MKKFTAVLLAVFVLAAFSAMLMADQEKGGVDGKGCMMMKGGFAGHQFGVMYSVKAILGMASELNLTSDQFEKLKAIEKDSPKKAFDKDAAKTDRDALKAEFEKNSPDEKTIDDMMDKMAAKRQDMVKAKIHEMLAVKAVLTNDQIDIIKKKMDNMKKKFEDMRKK